MADDTTAKPEPEIHEPVAAEPPRAARRDPGVIEGEATEIGGGATEPPQEPEPEPEPEPVTPPRRRALFMPAVFAGAGALSGAIIALLAAWLIDPRAAALDRSRADLATLQQSVHSQSGDIASLEARIAALENSAKADAKSTALDAIAGRVAKLESANAGAVANSALEEARAASAAAAKAADLANRAPPPAAPTGSPDEGALASRLDTLDQRLGALEGASAAAKTEARATPAASEAAHDTSGFALLALSLDQRFRAGEPYADELAALAKRGEDADALAPLKSFASAGAPTAAAIAADWAALEPRIAAALAPPPASGWDRLLDHMRALVRVRRIGAPAGAEDSDSRLAAIDAALARGDEAQALEAFDKLPPEARAAGADWRKDAAARQSAAAAAARLRAEALAQLSAQKD